VEGVLKSTLAFATRGAAHEVPGGGGGAAAHVAQLVNAADDPGAWLDKLGEVDHSGIRKLAQEHAGAIEGTFPERVRPGPYEFPDGYYIKVSRPDCLHGPLGEDVWVPPGWMEQVDAKPMPDQPGQRAWTRSGKEGRYTWRAPKHKIAAKHVCARIGTCVRQGCGWTCTNADCTDNDHHEVLHLYNVYTYGVKCHGAGASVSAMTTHLTSSQGVLCNADDGAWLRTFLMDLGADISVVGLGAVPPGTPIQPLRTDDPRWVIAYDGARRALTGRAACHVAVGASRGTTWFFVVAQLASGGDGILGKPDIDELRLSYAGAPGGGTALDCNGTAVALFSSEGARAAVAMRPAKAPLVAGELGSMSLIALKALAKERGIAEPNGNKGHKATWINALQNQAGLLSATPPRSLRDASTAGAPTPPRHAQPSRSCPRSCDIGSMGREQLKELATSLGITPEGDKRKKETWAKAIAAHRAKMNVMCLVCAG
jgi:hypothetical protein